MGAPTASPKTRAPSLALAVQAYLQGGVVDFSAFGVTREHVDRALYLATTPGDEQEADLLRIGAVLSAIRAPGCRIETVEVRTLVTDEAPEERTRRWADAGFFAEVTGRAPPPLPSSATDHVRAGRTDFLVEQAAAPLTPTMFKTGLAFG